MNRKSIGGLAVLGVMGLLATIAAPGAMAQGPSWRTWHDAADIRHDMRVIHGEDHRIAADRAALRHDYYSGNHYAAVRDREALHRDQRARDHARFDAHVDRHDLHRDWHH